MARIKSIFPVLNNISMRSKFIILYLFCIFVPVVVTNVALTMRLSNKVEEREKENISTSMERAMDDFRRLVSTMIAEANNVALDSTVGTVIKTEFLTPIDYFDFSYDNLRTKFNASIGPSTKISNITVYTDNNTIINGDRFYMLDNNVKKEIWYNSPERETKSLYLVIDYTNRSFSIIRRLNQFDLPKNRENYVKIDVVMTDVLNLLNSKKLSFFIADKAGKIIINSDEGLIEKNIMDISLSKNEMILKIPVGNESYFKDWELVSIYDRSTLTSLKNSEYQYTIFLNIIFGVIAACIIYVIFYSYKNRMIKAIQSIRKMDGCIFEIIEVEPGGDEVGELIQAINSMSVKINELINNVYKLEMQNQSIALEKVRAELKYLQSQVDPHFLFNVLNAMLVVSVKNNYSELTPQISNLAKLLRRLLNWSEDSEALLTEIQFIEMYLQIEKFRFGEQFNYVIEINDGAKVFKIPKMIIQPLVENACRHGLQNIDGVRNLRIQALYGDNRLKISVRDNGAGMNPDKLRAVKASLESNEQCGEHIGLRNVYRRLKLYFSDRMSMDINSEEGKETELIINIACGKDAF